MSLDLHTAGLGLVVAADCDVELHDRLELNLQQQTDGGLDHQVEGGGSEGGDPSWGLRGGDAVN